MAKPNVNSLIRSLRAVAIDLSILSQEIDGVVAAAEKVVLAQDKGQDITIELVNLTVAVRIYREALIKAG